MKSVIRGFILTIIIMLLTVISACIVQRLRFQTDLRSIVSDALVQTAQTAADERYTIEDNEEFMAEFEQNLLRSIKAVPEMELDIYYLGADIEKKIISVVVEQKMPYIFTDKTLTVNTQQSVIIDTDETEYIWYDIIYHNVSYDELPDDAPFVHTEGENTILPVPVREGSTFLHWEDEEGNIITEIKAEYSEAAEVYAVWE